MSRIFLRGRQRLQGRGHPATTPFLSQRGGAAGHRCAGMGNGRSASACRGAAGGRRWRESACLLAGEEGGSGGGEEERAGCWAGGL